MDWLTDYLCLGGIMTLVGLGLLVGAAVVIAYVDRDF